MKSIEIQQLAALLDLHNADLGLISDIAGMIAKHNQDTFHAPSFIQRATVCARNNTYSKRQDDYPPILDDLHLPAMLKYQCGMLPDK